MCCAQTPAIKRTAQPACRAAKVLKTLKQGEVLAFTQPFAHAHNTLACYETCIARRTEHIAYQLLIFKPITYAT